MEKKMLSDKLGTAKIPSLLLKMSIPAIISMFVQAMYNVVDSIFVSMYSQSALDAITIIMPIQMLIISFALGVGVGANTLISKYLGEKKVQKASEIATTAVILAVFVYLIFLCCGLFLSEYFVDLFTDDAEIIALGSEYLRIIMCMSMFCFMQITLEKILQSTGNMTVPMIAQLVGAITNIILDPIMIFGLLGCPKMNIAGAAYATIIGQFCGMMVLVIAVIFTRTDVNISLKNFKLTIRNVNGVLSMGVPVAIMNSIGSLTTISLNFILKPFMYGITVLGLYFKLQSFVFMPVFGLMQGMLPIMSYNYGAKNKARFGETFKCAVIIALSIMIVGMLIFLLFTSKLLTIFGLDGDKLATGVLALRILCMCFIPAAFGVTVSSSFQAIRCGQSSLWFSIFRQLLLIIPIAYLLSLKFGIVGVWMAYPISEFIAVGIFTPLYIKKFHKAFHC